MRFGSAFALAGALLVAPLGAQEQSGSGQAVALVGAAIYRSPYAGRLDDGVILIEEGRIAAVGTRQAVSLPKGTRVVEYSGSTIVAGFWNCHVHFTEPRWEGADTLPAAVLTARLQAMLTGYGFVRVLGRVRAAWRKGQMISTSGPWTGN
jgi:cytosine/adenosine deaminase-related metal-dependent hydrolase